MSEAQADSHEFAKHCPKLPDKRIDIGVASISGTEVHSLLKERFYMQTIGGDLFFASGSLVGSSSDAAAVAAVRLNVSRTINSMAISQDSSPCILESLSDLCSTRVLEHIAANPATPVALLQWLVHHASADVRSAVADNPSTPIECLWKLANDADADVRYQLSEHHRLPLLILEKLCEDDNPYVACRAQRTIHRLSPKQTSTGTLSWTLFRRSQLERRIEQVESVHSGTPWATLTKLCSSLYRCARAI